MKHQGQANKAARAQLQGRLSVDVEDVEKRRLYKADFALEVPLRGPRDFAPKYCKKRRKPRRPWPVGGY
jgi:hypothetical protein